MPESDIHSALIQSIVVWIETNTSFQESMAILVDGQFGRDCLPPNIGGSVPDVFASSAFANFALIGEAKTASDIETRHTRTQLSAYLAFLSNFESSLLVLAVPWYCTNQIRSLVRAIQRTTGTEQVGVHVLEQLPG
ncbi:hypothetical protein C7410_103280 [Paraburkholderia silvatlantica]|uniref:Uncharacterized protein n=1 Tax=Paraburkholderia silvatlantica TaxID=321895 RepID=A0A2V4TRE9_9BURK|nr:hypothetical protein [Paraburkholderia silvatlantica]PYE26361.1 hypothetical protein C7410_103280 [Paraburkholderia silvatlantica]